jgi:hypothetical protein
MRRIGDFCPLEVVRYGGMNQLLYEQARGWALALGLFLSEFADVI